MMPETNKLKIAVYWAAACGGCDVAITHLNEKILDLAAAADIVFWPCAMDFKYSDVEKMPDGFIDVCLFNGAIRTSEHEHVAKLLRKKSKVMVAFGACAAFGGIPGLSNLTTASASLKEAYLDEPSAPNPKHNMPSLKTQMPEGELTLPVIWDTVHSLKQVVGVEYFVPGCPPTVNIIAAAIDAIVSGKLPPVGTTIAGEGSVCTECKLEKLDNMRLKEYKRPWEIKPDPARCLMEQGMVCLGPATRAGCGAQCTAVLMPCRGCFGPMERILDQGAAALDAASSILDTNDEARIAELIDEIPDPAGTFYRFSLPESLLRRAASAREEKQK